MSVSASSGQKKHDSSLLSWNSPAAALRSENYWLDHIPAVPIFLMQRVNMDRNNLGN